MTQGEQELKYFWNRFEAILTENGNPFSLVYTQANRIKAHASVNKKQYMNEIALTVDFLVQKRMIRINVYIRDDLDLWEKLLKNKEQIDRDLGMKVEWVLEGIKNPNTRRIQYCIPMRPYERSAYDALIERSIVIIDRWMTVFKKYIPDLFDY